MPSTATRSVDELVERPAGRPASRASAAERRGTSACAASSGRRSVEIEPALGVERRHPSWNCGIVIVPRRLTEPIEVAPPTSTEVVDRRSSRPIASDRACVRAPRRCGEHHRDQRVCLVDARLERRPQRGVQQGPSAPRDPTGSARRARRTRGRREAGRERDGSHSERVLARSTIPGRRGATTSLVTYGREQRRGDRRVERAESGESGSMVDQHELGSPAGSRR